MDSKNEWMLGKKTKCRMCGKFFYIRGGDWGYVIGESYFCSYSCMRDKELQKRKPYSRTKNRYMRNEETGEILTLYKVAERESSGYSTVFKIFERGGTFKKVWKPYNKEE